MYSTLPSTIPGCAVLLLQMPDTVTRRVLKRWLCCCRWWPDGIGLGPPSQLNSCRCSCGCCDGCGCCCCCGPSCAAAAALQNTCVASACADCHVAPSCGMSMQDAARRVGCCVQQCGRQALLAGSTDEGRAGTVACAGARATAAACMHACSSSTAQRGNCFYRLVSTCVRAHAWQLLTCVA